MAIIKKENLIEKIKDYDLVPLEVNSFNISNQIHLSIDSIDDFLKFTRDLDSSKFLYYFYSYYHSKEYTIPQDWYSEHSNEFKTDVRRYNQHTESLDFGSPKSLTLFVLQSGTYVGVVYDNPWMENLGITVADKAIEAIEGKFYREVNKISANMKVQRKKVENELREIIFNDPGFKLCKNQALRYQYLVELLAEESMVKYDYLFQPYGYYKDGKIKWFMDVTWDLYKERSK